MVVGLKLCMHTCSMKCILTVEVRKRFKRTGSHLNFDGKERYDTHIASLILQDFLMLNTSQSFKHRNYSEETDKILLFVNLSNWPIQQMQFCVKIQFNNSCIALKFNLSYVKKKLFWG